MENKVGLPVSGDDFYNREVEEAGNTASTPFQLPLLRAYWQRRVAQ